MSAVAVGANQHTLYPVGPLARALPNAGLGDERVLVTYSGDYKPTLTDRWQMVVLVDGRGAIVRSADCGLGCRCAGEIRIRKAGAQ